MYFYFTSYHSYLCFHKPFDLDEAHFLQCNFSVNCQLLPLPSSH